jgi:hypothetical protein
MKLNVEELAIVLRTLDEKRMYFENKNKDYASKISNIITKLGKWHKTV